MDVNELIKLLDEGEGLALDFKENLSDSRGMSRLMASFANTDGGTILVGVADDGKITGVPAADPVIKSLTDWAHQNCNPPLRPTFGTVRISDDKVVVWANIARQSSEICLVDKLCYIRVGAQSVPVVSGGELKRVVERLQAPPVPRERTSEVLAAVAAPTIKSFQGRTEQLAQLRAYLGDSDITPSRLFLLRDLAASAKRR